MHRSSAKTHDNTGCKPDTKYGNRIEIRFQLFFHQAKQCIGHSCHRHDQKYHREPVRRIFKIPFRCLLWYDKYFSYHGCPVRISAYPRIQNTGTDDSSVFIKFFVFSPTNTASTAETIRKILLTCATKMRSIFAAPIYIFSKTEKYANSGIRPSTSCILRMPFPGQRRIVKSEITSMTAYP